MDIYLILTVFVYSWLEDNSARQKGKQILLRIIHIFYKNIMFRKHNSISFAAE